MTETHEKQEEEKEMGIKKIAEWTISKEHVTVPQAEVICIEPRLRYKTEEFLATSRAPGVPDTNIYPGGAMELASNDPKHALDKLAISYDKHGVRRFVLTVHEDCGGYGERMPYSYDKALEFMTEELRRARLALEGYFSGRGERPVVLTYAVMFDGVYEVS